ncbi:hypothetical protein ACHAXT_010945 [Thalassiosira profunda]
MCKIGVLAIGADLYHSASQHFQTLLFLLQNEQSIRRVLFDLAAHFFALGALVLTFRGRVNRRSAARIVFPVLAVRFAMELEELQRAKAARVGGEGEAGGQVFSLGEILLLTKSMMFVGITAKLAMGKDTSCIDHDEWLPKRQGTQEHNHQS